MAAMAKSSYHHGALEATLIDAAIVLIEEHGVDGFSLAATSRRAGVSVAAPYRHFANRRELLNAVAQRGFAELGERLRAAPADDGDDVALLLEQGLAYVRFAVEKPALFRIAFDSRGRDPQSTVGPAALAAFGETLDRLERAGRLRIPLDTAMRLCWATVHGVAMLTINQSRTFAEEDSETLRRHILSPMLTGGVITAD
ncbi:TetR/AcrR family transcriptional regulator [Pseudonocardia sp. TRM90224]|uniref:TetR/AcrR family transcriptional regulator n=1 Tax=Pseudonocardia sp. TRM90224 TaxID=2812678 RepID=UPI001E318D14|nr:TetR/AcrR family transcriptional regulator [Pseudonocardia sp. TRM90224]